MNEICIIGAGISGLALAYELEKSGNSCVILENTNRVGGVIRSEPRDGFLLEYSANSALADPELLKFIDELGLAGETAFPSPAAKWKYVSSFRDGHVKLLAAPRGIAGFFTSPILSVPGKFRVLGEAFVARTKKPDESAAEFFTRRFGSELCDNVAAAGLAGIWAGDPQRLSARSTLPRLWEIEQESGSLMRGMLKRSITSPFVRKLTMSFRRGMEQLPAAIAAKLRSTTIETMTSVQSAERTHDGWSVRSLRDGKESKRTFRKVILTAGPSASAAIVQQIDPRLADKIRSIPSAPVGLLHLSVAKGSTRHALNGFGALVPPNQNRALMGVLFSSTVFEGRAPAGRELLTCFSGGMSRPELAHVSNPAIRNRVISEVGELVGFQAPPDVLDANFLPDAIPNYPVGPYEIQAAVADTCGC